MRLRLSRPARGQGVAGGVATSRRASDAGSPPAAKSQSSPVAPVGNQRDERFSQERIDRHNAQALEALAKFGTMQDLQARVARGGSPVRYYDLHGL